MKSAVGDFIRGFPNKRRTVERMATEKLFYEDVYCRRFQAKVVSCVPGKHGFDVVLDKTAFYPEGGGQPGDTGTLSGVRVTDTHEAKGEIVHYCEKPLDAGSVVEGEIDWEHRFGLMQLHSGEHILSGIVHRRFGYDNVGFHMGADMVTIDFSGMLTEEDLRSIEREANEIVWENRPVTIAFPPEEELPNIPYRSKKALTGDVRIVTVENADICACCGTHVTRTGEIGLIKIFSCVKFHEGVRLEILCGMRAYDYVNLLIDQNRKNSALLSAKPTETNAAASRAMEELNAVKYRASLLENELFALKAKNYDGDSDVLLFEAPMSPDAVRRFADAILSNCTGRIAIFAGDDKEGYKYARCRKDGDLRQLVKELNAVCHGRGGGKPFFAQGSVAGTRAEIEAFFAQN